MQKLDEETLRNFSPSFFLRSTGWSPLTIRSLVTIAHHKHTGYGLADIMFIQIKASSLSKVLFRNTLGFISFRNTRRFQNLTFLLVTTSNIKLVSILDCNLNLMVNKDAAVSVIIFTWKRLIPTPNDSSKNSIGR